MEKTLLQKAKEIQNLNSEKPVSKEEVELAVAWARKDINLKQVMHALYGGDTSKASHAYRWLAVRLADHIREN